MTVHIQTQTIITIFMFMYPQRNLYYFFTILNLYLISSLIALTTLNTCHWYLPFIYIFFKATFDIFDFSHLYVFFHARSFFLCKKIINKVHGNLIFYIKKKVQRLNSSPQVTSEKSTICKLLLFTKKKQIMNFQPGENE